MLIAALLPLLARYSLGFDLTKGNDNTVTLTIIPRRGDNKSTGAGELRPLSITGSADEIDAELALGETGALGRLVAVRKCLADQVADQEAADTLATAQAKAVAAARNVAATAQAKAAATARAEARPAKPGAATAQGHVSFEPETDEDNADNDTPEAVSTMADIAPAAPASLW